MSPLSLGGTMVLTWVKTSAEQNFWAENSGRVFNLMPRLSPFHQMVNLGKPVRPEILLFFC